MPKRPRQHIIEDLARAALHDAFARVGWTTEDLSQDYGEDLLVRIFDNGQATPWSLFVQSRGTDHLDRFRMKDGSHIAFPVKSDHAKHWERFWEPVVLAVYDTQSKRTYWEIIQTFLHQTPSLSVDDPRASLTIHVPIDNTLDDEGLRRLRNYTRRRFERFEAQQEGAQILIEELKEQWGVEIEYEPEFGLLILPTGEFKADASGGRILTPFGRCAARFDKLYRRDGIDAQSALDKGLTQLYEARIRFMAGDKLQLLNRKGKVEQECRTFDEYMRHIKRAGELLED
jgi:Domain of unknown function (DUF4365)